MSDYSLTTVVNSATLEHLVQQNQSAYRELQERNRLLTDQCARLTSEVDTLEGKVQSLFNAADRLSKMNDRQVQLLCQVINENEKECTIVGLKHKGVKMTVAGIRTELLKHPELVVKYYRKYINKAWALQKTQTDVQTVYADLRRQQHDLAQQRADFEKEKERANKRPREDQQTIVYCTNEK